jgi:hypothetical protein
MANQVSGTTDCMIGFCEITNIHTMKTVKIPATHGVNRNTRRTRKSAIATRQPANIESQPKSFSIHLNVSH